MMPCACNSCKARASLVVSFPNNVVENGEIDANYFQHQPYLDDFNAENNTHLVSVVAVHYEPFGIYSKQHASLDELAEGAVKCAGLLPAQSG